ncbi:hypothetical protein GCM10027425_15590 [Alteromonas gracilis]
MIRVSGMGARTGVGWARRLLDVAVALPALVLVAPVLLVAGLLVRLDGGPATFRQERVGEGGRPFRIVKLRTMRSGPGAGVTAAYDARITRVGRVLRRSCVDELPQLWHVLVGDMTLVGPRPESLDLARRYPESAREVLSARPGLTGPSQLRYRERSVAAAPGDPEAFYLEVLVPLRARADLEFLERPTLRRTLAWVVRTVLFVVGARDYEEVDIAASRTRMGSQAALTQAPVVRSNSKL